ncbi:hypothetical protein Tco_1479661 [Tanacetum coccineum]
MAKLQDGKTRLCLVDDLKALKITSSLTKQDKGTSSCLKSKDTTTYSQDEANERYEVYELRTKDKAFGGNVESKKMQKNVLKQQFENFSISDTEGLDKAYDRFQKLISLLEVHGATISNEDANLKFLRALPSSWNNIALIMRNKEGYR